MSTVKTDDLRITDVSPVINPHMLLEQIPSSETAAATTTAARESIQKILDGEDDRILVVVGPCSIHDPVSAREYASRLLEQKTRLSDHLLIVMRVYFEKPRTRLGWRGLILDPHLDGSSDIESGLKIARELLLRITGTGLPAGSEVLDPIVPQYTSDLLTWASIGARTTESQTHREMASGLSMPVGFKNGTDGSIETAINALSSARGQHSFIGIDQDGKTAVFTTSGNDAGHVILRGGRNGPNYHDEDIDDTCRLLTEAGHPATIMIDCSHSNSLRDPSRQGKVLKSIIRQRREGQTAIIGFMLESNLVGGKQSVAPARELTYGQSITDPCMGWDETEDALRSAHSDLGVVR